MCEYQTIVMWIWLDFNVTYFFTIYKIILNITTKTQNSIFLLSLWYNYVFFFFLATTPSFCFGSYKSTLSNKCCVNKSMRTHTMFGAYCGARGYQFKHYILLSFVNLCWRLEWAQPNSSSSIIIRPPPAIVHVYRRTPAVYSL